MVIKFTVPVCISSAIHLTLGLEAGDLHIQIGAGDGDAVLSVHNDRYLTSFADNLKPYTLKSCLAYVPTVSGSLNWAGASQ